MRFSTFFTSTTPVCSSGRALIVLGGLLLSGVHAQDRTTEAGEAQITGASAFVSSAVERKRTCTCCQSYIYIPRALLMIIPQILIYITIADPNAECVAYNYPPVSSRIAQFPPVWQIASILPSDTDAQTMWAGIQPSVPNIAPKVCTFFLRYCFDFLFISRLQGTPTGNISNVSYPATDPDCWWTYTHCLTPKLPGLVPDIADVPEVCRGFFFNH